MTKHTQEQLSLPIDEVPAELPALNTTQGIYHGTDGFIFPEWGDLVWHKKYDKLELYHHGLIEYTRHELFETICIPPKKYPSPPERDLQCFGHQMPERFPCFCAIHPIMTHPRATPAHPIVPEDREALPHHNPHFLDPDYFLKTIYPPFKKFFQQHLQAFIFEFPEHLSTSGVKPELLNEKLDNFATKMPPEIKIALALPHNNYFNQDYIALLKSPNLWHVFNCSPQMPSPLKQLLALCEQKEWLLLWAPKENTESIGQQQIQEILQQREQEPCFIITKNNKDCLAPKSIKKLRKVLGEKL